MTAVRFAFTEQERRIFTRVNAPPVSEWAAVYLIIQDGPYKGSPLRLDVAPFLAGPMDAFSAPGVEEVIVCGSLQVGKTLFLYACLGWSVVYRHGVKMLPMPTKDSRDNVRERKLDPLFKGSPTLRRLVAKYRRGSISLKDGTSILFPTAESPGLRASITVRDLFPDEEDLYGGSGASRALDDFKGRTRSFEDDRKIARACQPKGGEESSIWRGITREADLLLCYEVECPACRQRHLPDVANITVPEEEKDPRAIRRRKLARYRCPNCKWLWSDHIRDLAVRAGGWKPYRWHDKRGFEPGPAISRPKVAGFHIPAILSRMVSLSDLEARRLLAEASDDPELKRQYYNDDLALPYVPVEMQTDAERVLSLRQPWLPPRCVPHGTVALTCGIDMQKRGFWFLVKAWMPNMASYIIDYGTLESWEDAARLAFDTWYPVLAEGGAPGHDPVLPVPGELLNGEVKPIWRVALDSGGTETEGVYTRTEEAYLWVRANGAGVIHACKGASHAQAAAVRRVIRERMPHNGRPIPGGLPLYFLDTGGIKTVAFSRLLNAESSQPCRLHSGCGQDLADQLSSEQQVRKNGKLIWERKGGMNHLTDCLMLADAAADATWTPSLPHYVMQLQASERAAHRAPSAPKPSGHRQESPARPRRDRRSRR